MRIAPRLVVLSALMVFGALCGCQKSSDSATTVTAPISPPAASGKAAAAGLWTQTVSDGGKVSVVRYCLDEAAAAQVSALGSKLAGRCASKDVVPSDAGGWRFATACDAGGGGGKTITAGVVRGDPPTHPIIEALTRTAGSGEAPRRLKVEIRWQKDCPKNISPGEVVWPDGRRTRLSDLAAPS